MKVYIDGKEVKCLNDVKVIVEVEPSYGITQTSDLEIKLSHEGISIDVVEITKASAPSAEVTLERHHTYDEFESMMFGGIMP